MVVLKRPLRTLSGALILFSVLLLSGILSAQTTTSARLIIKFNDPAIEPTQSAIVTTLSEDIGLPLEYLRPMSGQAHILLAHDILNDEHLEQVIQRLSARPDVLSVQRDQIFLTQSVR